MKRDNNGRFLKGTNGNTFEGFGVWHDKKGYPCIWIDNKIIKLHVYVWERENGKKPKGYDVHHKDFDKRNYNLENLELLSHSDHRRVHAGWIRENGKWIKKPCQDCKELLPLDFFYPRKGMTPSNKCKKCSAKFWKEKRQNDPEFRRQKNQYSRQYYEKSKA